MGLEALSRIGGSLSVGHNDSLTTVAHLSGLSTVERSVQIFGNPSLLEITALRISRIGEWLIIEENNSIVAVEFPDLTMAGEIWINYNEALETVRLDALESVAYGIEISSTFYYPQALVRLVSARSLETVGDYFIFYNGDYSGEVELSLPALQSVGGEFEINADGVANPDVDQLVEVGALSLIVTGLSDLSRFANLERITGELNITGNDSLEHCALPNLTLVGGDFRIQRNPELPTAEAVELALQVAADLDYIDDNG